VISFEILTEFDFHIQTSHFSWNEI